MTRSPVISTELRALLAGQNSLFRSLKNIELGVKVSPTGAVSIPGGVSIGGTGDGGLVLGPTPDAPQTKVLLANTKPGIIRDLAHTQAADENGSTITFTWNEPEGLNVDLQGTEFRWKRSDKDGWSRTLVPDFDHTVEVIGALTYDFELRAVTILGVRSDVVATTVKIDGDKTKPAKVQNVSVATGYRTVMVAWNPNTEADLDYYRVQVVEATDFTSDEKLGDFSKTLGNLDDNILKDEKVRTTLVTFSDLKTEVTYSARVKAVDFSGNESEEWAGDLNGVTELVESAHIRELFADKIKSGTITSTEMVLDAGGGNSSLRSSNFDGDPLDPFTTPGTEGWAINGDGDSAFNRLIARGDLIAESLATEEIGDQGHIEIGAADPFAGGVEYPSLVLYTDDDDEVSPAVIQNEHVANGAEPDFSTLVLASSVYGGSGLRSYISLGSDDAVGSGLYGPSILISANFGNIYLSADNWVASTTWTPAVTQTGSFTENILRADYEVSNGWCSFVFDIDIDAGTGTAGAAIIITLPVATGLSNLDIHGTFTGTAGTDSRGGKILGNTSTTMRFAPDPGNAGIWGVNAPSFALATGDRIWGAGRYKIA